MLDIAIKAGANQSGQTSWSLADQDGLQAKAAKQPLERARQIAQQTVAGLNATLGPLIYASNEAPPRERFGGGSGGGRIEMRAAAPKAVAPLSLGAHKVTASATVYAVFSIQ